MPLTVKRSLPGSVLACNTTASQELGACFFLCMYMKAKVIVIGGGLAVLSCSAELVENDIAVTLFEACHYLGGRTASWNDHGMRVESGLHRYLGFYSEMPGLLKKAGLDLDKAFYWEDEIIIALKGGITGSFGAAPLFKPLKTLKSAFGNNHIFDFKDINPQCRRS
jgi:15-cis-phytoene desaturase